MGPCSGASTHDVERYERGDEEGSSADKETGCVADAAHGAVSAVEYAPAEGAQLVGCLLLTPGIKNLISNKGSPLVAAHARRTAHRWRQEVHHSYEEQPRTGALTVAAKSSREYSELREGCLSLPSSSTSMEAGGASFI